MIPKTLILLSGNYFVPPIGDSFLLRNTSIFRRNRSDLSEKFLIQRNEGYGNTKKICLEYTDYVKKMEDSANLILNYANEAI